VVRELATHRINIVATLREYAQRDFGARGVESAVRLSPHYYNTFAEVDAAVDALSTVMRTSG
jgi:selenocysteine lyase/cysteine desulfurase